MCRLKTESFKKENSDFNKFLIELSNGNRHKIIMAQHSKIQSWGYYSLHTSKISCKLQILLGNTILTVETFPTTTKMLLKLQSE